MSKTAIETQTEGVNEAARLSTMAARFAPTEIGADLSRLSPADRQVLAKLVEASKIIDALFLRQVWAGNEAMLLDLVRDETPEGRARLHYFLINKGPWSRLDHNEPFVAGAPPKPAGANFYPEGATEGGDRALDRDAAGSRARARHRLLHRDPPTGESVHARPLQPSSIRTSWRRRRRCCARRRRLATEPTLKTFLTKRADAFLSNDYYDSDVAWMELKGAIEPTIGPYEVYEDEFFNYKAAFESFITVRDEAESAKLQKFGGELQDIENHLPIDPKHRNPKLGALAPIVVVNEIYAAGDAQPRRADGRLQPAERRARGQRKRAASA